MISQRATFSLKGTNIKMPGRYKIRSVKHSKISIAAQINSEYPKDYTPLILQTRKNDQPAQNKQYNKKPSNQQSILTFNNNIGTFSSLLASKITKQNYQIKQQNIKIPKRCSCGDCQDCLKDFAYFLHIFTDDQSIPQISAKSWCIYRKKVNNKYMYYYGKRIHKIRQIASLSKMITSMVMMDYLNRYNYDPSKIKYQIKKNSLMVKGTSANLQLGQELTLYDLLYAMMLPSGNDAAIAISQVIGLMIYLKNKNKQINPYQQQWYQPYRQKNYSYLFIMLMNEKCQKLGTIDTHMYNSHGNDAYDQLKNTSTCNEIAKIACDFMNYPLLREIVSKKNYKKWQNTNKLLNDGFEGIKTGITDTAGPCLAAAYKDIIIVVLNSKSMNQRWIQVKKLVKWIMMKTS